MEHLRLYDNTVDRDTDPRIWDKSLYPFIDCIDYETIELMSNHVSFHSDTSEADKIHLYDILAYVNGQLRIYHTADEALTAVNADSINNELVALCVIAEGILPDGDARFISLTELETNMWGNVTDSTMYSNIETLTGSTGNGTRTISNKWFNIYLNSSGETKYNYLIPLYYYDNENSTRSYESWNTYPCLNVSSAGTDESRMLYDWPCSIDNYTGCFPSDEWTANGTISNHLDSGYLKRARYYYGAGNANANYERYIPSPYDGHGKLNPRYVADYYILPADIESGTHTSLNTNVLSKFDGREKTLAIVKAMLEADQYAPLWNNVTKRFKDSCAAYRAFSFSTKGTVTGTPAYDASTISDNLSPLLGDWYLPTIGEWGFVCVRKKAINNVLTALGKTQVAAGGYWSSSQSNVSSSYIVRFSNGNAGYNGKNDATRVRPFLRKKMVDLSQPSE